MPLVAQPAYLCVLKMFLSKVVAMLTFFRHNLVNGEPSGRSSKIIPWLFDLKRTHFDQ